MHNEELPDNRTWSAYDETASEFEVGDFMFGLARASKPLRILETGCYLGHTTKRLLEAVKLNGCGEVITCDTRPEMVEKTENLALGLGLGGLLWAFCMEGVELCRGEKYVWMAFLDSSGDRREEAKLLNTAPGALVVLHDATRPAFDDIVSDHPNWKHIRVSTPRGLAVFQTS